MTGARGVRTTALGALGLALLASACGGGPPRPAARPDPSVLHAPSEYPGAFLDRQHITATYGTRKASFDAVLQKRGDELVLLGMTPFGSRAFVLKQTGVDVTFESFVPQELPFPPRYILLDVHRVFFDGVAPGPQALDDGMHDATRDGEQITERWQGGRLWQRRIRRVNADPAGEIVIDYDAGMPAGGPPPAHVGFANGWYGYRLDITTQSHELI
jgi:hypothetical protein